MTLWMGSSGSRLKEIQRPESNKDVAEPLRVIHRDILGGMHGYVQQKQQRGKGSKKNFATEQASQPKNVYRYQNQAHQRHQSTGNDVIAQPFAQRANDVERQRRIVGYDQGIHGWIQHTAR